MIKQSFLNAFERVGLIKPKRTLNNVDVWQVGLWLILVIPCGFAVGAFTADMVIGGMLAIFVGGAIGVVVAWRLLSKVSTFIYTRVY